MNLMLFTAQAYYVGEDKKKEKYSKIIDVLVRNQKRWEQGEISLDELQPSMK